MKKYVLDVGSHSLKMYELSNSSATLIDTHTWRILEQDNLLATVHSSVNTILQKAVPGSTIKAIGTEALRRDSALNKMATEVLKTYGISLQVISQVEEAELIRLAFIKTHHHVDIDVVNVGGGSIQIIHQNMHMTLLNFGICDLNTRFSLDHPPHHRKAAECIAWIESQLPQDLREFAYTGGELTYLNHLKIPTESGWCQRSSFTKMAEYLASLDSIPLEALSPYDPKWMRGAVASNCLVMGMMNKISAHRFFASDLNITNGFVANL